MVGLNQQPPEQRLRGRSYDASHVFLKASSHQHSGQVRGNLRAERKEVFDLVCTNLQKEFFQICASKSSVKFAEFHIYGK